jgi:hypothetical protein
VKRYTSKFLRTTAWVYLVFPASYLAFAAVLFDVPMSALSEVLMMPLFYLNSAAGTLAGYGLREMRRWAWYLLIVSAVLIGYQNAQIAQHLSEAHHKVPAYIASLLILAGVLHRISREVRVPYFFPKIRWWESNPRYKLSVPAKVQGAGPVAVDGEILDLSLGGCFIKVRSELAQDEKVNLTFKVFGLPVACQGTVVWRTHSTVTHPRGVGIKFALETRVQKRVLRQINSRLRKIATLYRRSRYLMSQDEFLKRLDELEGDLAKRGA